MKKTSAFICVIGSIICFTAILYAGLLRVMLENLGLIGDATMVFVVLFITLVLFICGYVRIRRGMDKEERLRLQKRVDLLEERNPVLTVVSNQAFGLTRSLIERRLITRDMLTAEELGHLCEIRVVYRRIKKSKELAYILPPELESLDEAAREVAPLMVDLI